MPLCIQCSLPYPSGDTDAIRKADFCSQNCQDRWYQTLVSINATTLETKRVCFYCHSSDIQAIKRYGDWGPKEWQPNYQLYACGNCGKTTTGMKAKAVKL